MTVSAPLDIMEIHFSLVIDAMDLIVDARLLIRRLEKTVCLLDVRIRETALRELNA